MRPQWYMFFCSQCPESAFTDLKIMATPTSVTDRQTDRKIKYNDESFQITIYVCVTAPFQYCSDPLSLLLFVDAEATEGIDAHTVYGYVIHDDDSKSRVDLSYPLDEHKKVSTGRSFHHGRFIMGLRREATKAG